MSEEDGSLCCCEYLDVNAERNHILACCCNCVDFDEAFESLISSGKISPEHKSRLLRVLSDRMRIPWKGGAIQIAVDAVLPVVILPIIFCIAAISLWWTVFMFSTVIVFLAYIFHFFIRTIPNTKFFFSWTITSIVLLYIIFEFIVIPMLSILLVENISLGILIGAFLTCLYLLKNRATQAYWLEATESGIKPDGVRFHNCSICQTTIPDKDHHCIWFDCCIGRHNQCLFILCLFFAILALLYSSNLILTAVCHPFRFYKSLLLPDDCSEVYEQFEFGISFVAAVYTVGVAGILIIIFLQQIFLVSVGLTSKEWKRLTLGSKCLLACNVRKPHNLGFFSNWARIICFKQEQCYSPLNQL